MVARRVMSGLSPRRRALLIAASVVVTVAVATVAAALLSGGDRLRPIPAQDQPGPVLLVPGYGGDTGAVTVLAERIRATGRDAIVVRLPGDGTGDLARQADALDEHVAERCARTCRRWM